MKDKIYIKNPYEKTATYKVENLSSRDQGYNFNLDENIIYRGIKGKIPGDSFTLNNLVLIDYKEGKKMEFLTETKPMEEVEIVIDWNKRLNVMQHNLARVIISIALLSLLNTETVDYVIDEVESTIVISGKDLSFSNLKKIEDLANYLLRSNLLVSLDYTEEGDSLIKIGQFEALPYSGPFLKRTGEVSLIKIININKQNDLIYINYKCGKSAYDDYFEKFNLFNNLKLLTRSQSDEELIANVKSLKLKLSEKNNQIKKLENELGLKYMDQFLKLANNINGINIIYKVLTNISFKDLKFTSSKIMDKNNYVQIYGIPNGNVSQILVCRSKNLNIDLKTIFDEIKNEHKLNGGGNMYLVQANCPTSYLSEAMEDYLIKIKNYFNI